MSQPRRRRRRRKGAPRPPEGQQRKRQKQSQVGGEARQGAASSRRRRRKGRGVQREKSPASSEDLVRAPKKPTPETLTAPHDGTTLEQVIGELQSEWGVPQNPQEYRLVFKVPEDKEARGQQMTATEEAVDPPDEQTDADKPRREKAPAAPRIGASGDGKPAEARPSRRRRGRRRRKRSKGGSGN